MSTELRLRRGTAAEHSAFTGAAGEVTVNTSDNRLVVHDGSTAGGVAHAKLTEVTLKANNLSDLPDKAAARTNLGAQQADATLAALAGLTTAADQIPFATGPDTFAMTPLTAAARGLLDDVDTAAMRQTLGLGTAALRALLGTVSQASGVPTGAIIERGSNANGQYVRYADGTQICWTRFNFLNQTVTQTGNIFRGPATVVGNFPASFIDVPTVAPGGTSGAGGGWPAQDVYHTATSWGSWSTRHAVSDANAGVLCLIAIGRWF